MKLEIKKGSVFGNFKVIDELPRLRLPSGQTNRVFKCECICGNTKDIRIGHLVRERINNCGCLKISNITKTNEEKYIRKIWRAIKYRTSENYFERHLYYDKGVIFCDEWKNNFDNFLKWSLENGLKKGLHIDRIDGNGNYHPSNCRVVTPVVNANNKVDTFYVEYKGTKIAFMILVRKKNLIDNYPAIRGRLKRGWSVEDAFDTPIRKGNYKRNDKTI